RAFVFLQRRQCRVHEKFGWSDKEHRYSKAHAIGFSLVPSRRDCYGDRGVAVVCVSLRAKHDGLWSHCSWHRRSCRDYHVGECLVCDLAESEENHRCCLEDRPECRAGAAGDGGVGAHGLDGFAYQFHAVDPYAILHGSGQSFHSLTGPASYLSSALVFYGGFGLRRGPSLRALQKSFQRGYLPNGTTVLLWSLLNCFRSLDRSFINVL